MSTVVDISVLLLNEVQLESECIDNYIEDRISQYKVRDNYVHNVINFPYINIFISIYLLKLYFEQEHII